MGKLSIFANLVKNGKVKKSIKYEARQKDTWARLRCGSALTGEKKGHPDNAWRACREETKTLQHVIRCEAVMKKVGELDKNWLKDSREDGMIGNGDCCRN